MPQKPQTTLSRRGFVATLATVSILPRHVLGGPEQKAPSKKPALGGIGVGGVGFGQLQQCQEAGFQIVALCDVDDVYAKKAFDKWPQARRYRDYREMLATEGDKLDAVYCGTPDHTHAVITAAALRKKKHVCCVKPLTRTIHESRAIGRLAREAGVATQVTAQANTSERACRICEAIGAGVIGNVREVHIWTNRPIWPQGMERPEGEDPIPSTFDWNLWLGPAAMRPFKNAWPDGHLALKQSGGKLSRGVYHPFNFRGWWAFGSGALGDMGCHYLNTPFRALKLKYPTSVHASATKVLEETAPLASCVTYEFPAREGLAPVKVVWYDGGLKPPYPKELAGRALAAEGALYIGDEGKMLDTEVLDETLRKKAAAVPRTLPRRSGTWGEWYESCTGGESAGCNFDWAGPLTEFVLLGNIAIRAGKWLAWDGENGKFTNDEAANKYLQEPYREGWSL